MKPLARRFFYCLAPIVVGLVVIVVAWWNYSNPPLEVAGVKLLPRVNFKLGVDLVGGTILVYEIDPKKTPDNYSKEQLVAALKRRLDPADLYNITIRPVSETRVEIILPTGGRAKRRATEKAWKDFLEKVKQEYNLPELSVRLGNIEEVRNILFEKKVAPQDQVEKFLSDNWAPERASELTGEDVERFKGLVSQVGSLEFRFLANTNDDEPAITAAKDYLKKASESWSRLIKEIEKSDRYAHARPKLNEIMPGDVQELRDTLQGDGKVPAAEVDLFLRSNFQPGEELRELINRNLQGLPPPPPGAGKPFPAVVNGEQRQFTYTWVEIGKMELHSLRLNAANKDSNPEWKLLEAARNRGEPFQYSTNYPTLIYSRKILTPSKDKRPSRVSEKDWADGKRIEYYFLTRNTPAGGEVTGEFLTSAREDTDQGGKLAVGFRFNAEGARRFYELTSLNKPAGQDGPYRHLAVILDGQIMSAPRLNQPIREAGQISGRFTKAEVNNLITILRAGALPATLIPQPVSENTMGATLGDDTIRAGTFSIGIAFLAILVFMLVYYRFAGCVACIALIANLILTVAFMVLVNATFTLPGLAGLVLTLGMAVDANILIYERLREERERGATLQLALRNGYDRAFPTIIDTHLTSIFTAVVLYVVGNDQLKGFGISLTVGLLISLFTALYMTRVIFDLWQSKGWLKKLSMAKLLNKPNVPFMRYRQPVFLATITTAVLGVLIFLMRGTAGLNMDFVGGTVYSAQLNEMMNIKQIRDALSQEKQKERLSLAEDPVSLGAFTWQLKYPDGDTRVVTLEGEVSAAEVRRRAEILPDVAPEITFHSSEELSKGDSSKIFTIRTTEKSVGLVSVAIQRLLGDKLKITKLTGYGLDQFAVSLPEKTTMTAGELKTILDAALKDVAPKGTKVTGTGAAEGDKYSTFQVDLLGGESPGPALLAKLQELVQGKKLAEVSVTVAYLHLDDFLYPAQVKQSLEAQFRLEQHQVLQTAQQFSLREAPRAEDNDGRFKEMVLTFPAPVRAEPFVRAMATFQNELNKSPIPLRLEKFDSQLARDTQQRALYAIVASWAAVLLYLWFRFGNWTFGLAAVICLIHDICMTLGVIALCHWISHTFIGSWLLITDFKIDLPAVAALLTLIGFSVNDTIVVFDRIREVRGKNPYLTPEMINDSVNQTLSRTILTSLTAWLVVVVLYVAGGEGVHLFAFVMVVGVIVGTLSSIFVASPLLLYLGEGARPKGLREERPAEAVP